MITGGKYGQVKITIEGAEQLGEILRNIPEEAEDAVEKELKKIALDLQGKAQELAPVDEGDLRGSGFNEVARLQASVGFTEPYAMRQHEELEYKHAKGGQAKYLEAPFKANIGKYVKRIGDAIKKAVEKRK